MYSPVHPGSLATCRLDTIGTAQGKLRTRDEYASFHRGERTPRTRVEGESVFLCLAIERKGSLLLVDTSDFFHFAK